MSGSGANAMKGSLIVFALVMVTLAGCREPASPDASASKPTRSIADDQIAGCYSIAFGNWTGTAPVIPANTVRLLDDPTRSVLAAGSASLNYEFATWMNSAADSIRITFIDGVTGTYLDVAPIAIGRWQGTAGAWFHHRTSAPVVAPVALHRVVCPD